MADNFNLRQFLSENKLTKNAKLLNEEEQQEAYQPKSKLEQIIQAAWAEKDLNKAKQIVVDLIEPSRVKSKDQILQTIQGIQNKPKLDQYLANSLLKFEKLGLSEETDNVTEGGNWGVTLDGRPVDISSIEIDGMDPSDRPDYSDAYIAYAEFEDGTELTEEELDRLQNENYGIIHDLIYDRGLDEGIHDRNILSRPLSNPAIEPLDQSPEELGKAADARSENILRMTYRNQINDPNISDEELKYILSGKGVKGFGGTPNAIANILASRSRMEEAKSYKVSKNSKEAQHLKKGDIIGSGDEVVSVSAGAKTPSGKVEVTLKTKDGKTKTSTWGKTTKVGVKQKETVKENTMTQRDRYLTRLVENALGLEVTEDYQEEGYGDDSVISKLEKRGEELPERPTYSEGEEMVEEKPLPKYENIEKLMQEIDKSTDQEAHKFKMQEMKRVADMLEKKCTALEEGDDADHIDQKKLKQMKKDIMTLRKGIEKMEKLGEKKFAKKETKQTKSELKEGFDLRNFLVENKLTTNSRMLKEYGGYAESLVGLVDEFYNNQLDAGIDPAELVQELTELIEYCNEQIQQLQSEM